MIIITRIPIAQFLNRHLQNVDFEIICNKIWDISRNMGNIKNTGLFKAANPHNIPEITAPQNEWVFEVKRYEINMSGVKRLAAFSVKSMLE